MSFRLKWTLGQLGDMGAYRRHADVLQAPMQYYLGLLRKLVPGLHRNAIRLQLKDGHSIPVREFMTLYAYNEIFVDRCYDVATPRKDPVIVDIGANTGLFALRMKQLYPLCRVFCYEPFPANFDQLQETIRVNGLQGVTTIRKAVGGRAGSARLYVHQRNLGGHSFFAQQASSDVYIDVEVVELRRILDELGQAIDILKIDCEGAEFEILMGLAAAQAARLPLIMVEPMPRLYDVKQMIAHMRSLQYAHEYRNGLLVFRAPVVGGVDGAGVAPQTGTGA